MKRIGVIASLLAAAALAPASARAEGPRLQRLFPNQAPILAEKAGLARLPLPLDVLGACRPDLSDLRVLDAAGSEVPFLVDRGVSADRRLEAVRRMTPPILKLDRDEARREDGPPLHRETIEIAAPPSAAGESWVLVVRAAASRFVRRMNVLAVSAAGTSPLLENESLFRLDAAREKTSFPLPSFTGDRLIVTLEGEDGFFLEPSLELTSARALGGGETLVVPLVETSREQEGNQTVLVFARPTGLVPDALRFTTTTPWFDRRVQVEDELPSGVRQIVGGGGLFRLQGLAAVERLEIPVRPARGERLRVVVFDGDSPSLADLVVSAVVRHPSLILSLPAAGAGSPAATLFFGGGRAEPPHYDLAGVMPAAEATLEGKRAVAAAYLRDPATFAPAALGEISANPAFDPAPALAFAMRPGAEVDPRLYSHRRPLAITPSAEGLARISLSASEIAVAREDLADVRVVDGTSRQWPYLLDREHAHERVRLPVETQTRRGAQSRYALRIPAEVVRIAGLAVDPDTAFVDRAFRLVGVADDAGRAEVMLASGRLQRRAQGRRPLQVSFPARRVRSLVLEVDDGNEAPLALPGADADLLGAAIFVTAPAGEYELLVGNPDDALPRYELERVRDVVLAVASAPVAPGSLEANPGFRMQARLETGEGPQIVLLWVALGAAVVILGGITLRMARAEEPRPGSGRRVP